MNGLNFFIKFDEIKLSNKVIGEGGISKKTENLKNLKVKKTRDK